MTTCRAWLASGRTNAGKSTLLNQLAGASTVAEDKLFATLDPTSRRVCLGEGQELLFTDTVGFVPRLPATLEEVAEADFLVHVVVASSPSPQRRVEAVERELEETGEGERPIVIALNKADLLPPDGQLPLPATAAALPSVRISALHSGPFALSHSSERPQNGFACEVVG